MNDHGITVNDPERLVDRFGRTVDYVRLSVTDRCDFRCVYCMSEKMTFLPREQVLSLEEIYTLAKVFVGLGVKKIRLTGGEPLVRRGVLGLVERIAVLGCELVITTNGSQLKEMAAALKQSGVSRINVSLDSIEPSRFKKMTRIGSLERVISGIDAAVEQGFERIKINAVILRNQNDDEILPLIEFARKRGIDISFIEEMPLGNITSHSREQAQFSSEDVRAVIQSRYSLERTPEKTAGPSTYYKMKDSPSRVGFISPNSHNFCAECNRVRVTVEGRLLLCLGNEYSVDLRDVLRSSDGEGAVRQAIIDSMQLKPERHWFDLTDEDTQVVRFMNMTGG